MPKTPRRPDGVVLEPPRALPSPADRAPASGIVALREPLADKDVEDVVRAYVRAFEREDLDALVQLLAQEAAPIGRAGSKAQLIDLWRTKMKNFEYQKLAGVEVARVAQIEKHTYDTLGVSGAPVRPTEMRPGDLYVRVPIATPRVGSDQLFGDILILILRREESRLKIAGQADESGP
jgi:predicted polyphosphate/ATP-dependent NAD kinase